MHTSLAFISNRPIKCIQIHVFPRKNKIDFNGPRQPACTRSHSCWLYCTTVLVSVRLVELLKLRLNNRSHCTHILFTDAKRTNCANESIESSCERVLSSSNPRSKNDVEISKTRSKQSFVFGNDSSCLSQWDQRRRMPFGLKARILLGFEQGL